MRLLPTSPFSAICSAMAAALASDPAATGQAPVEHQRSTTIARGASHRELPRSTLKSDDGIDTAPVEITWQDVAALVALGLFMFGLLALSSGISDAIIAARQQ